MGEWVLRDLHETGIIVSIEQRNGAWLCVALTDGCSVEVAIGCFADRSAAEECRANVATIIVKAYLEGHNDGRLLGMTCRDS